MRGRYHIMVGLIALLTTGCLEEKMKKAQEAVEWKTMDSVFQYMIPQPGVQKFSKGDSVRVGIMAVFGNGGVTPIDTAYVEKGCLRFAELWTKGMLFANDSGIVKKSEAGLLKADFSVIDWRKDFVVQAYLKNTVKQDQVDTLLKKLRRLPQVHRAKYISKEEAKKRWLAAGETDFKEFLDENPLPESIELQIEPDYLNALAMQEFAAALQ
jgi:hypothetical protein